MKRIVYRDPNGRFCTRKKGKRRARAKKGHKTRKARALSRAELIAAGPRYIPIVPQVYVRVEPRPEVKRAPEVLTQDDIDALIADFAQKRIHPDQWARDLANAYDLEIGPLYKEYFANLYVERARR